MGYFIIIFANSVYFRTVNDSIVFESQATKAHANMLS